MKRTAILRRTPMMKARPKKRAGHDKAMLKACQGESCYLAIPGVCRGDIATVVPAHANWADYGKGMGIKARDEYTVPACRDCHSELDQGRHLSKDERRLVWESAYREWLPAREQKLYAKSAAVSADAKTATSSGLQSLGGRLIKQ